MKLLWLLIITVQKVFKNSNFKVMNNQAAIDYAEVTF